MKYLFNVDTISRTKIRLLISKLMTKELLTRAIKSLLIETLSLDISPSEMADDALLLGDIPEFDSMAIVSIITALEETYEFVSNDDELTAEVFESVQSVVEFVHQQTT